ncbi:hypothetical protein QTP70_035132 [Hemibagrus guttatus]|uniref:Uncharacterized protein n=1 Tax=Hemibagrus guttatus TaxID=175788 RepID=A0AAE0UJQ3_9TELE|nr:hypothetical protein QTP70_035132 [Hemibagrus guttatus]KAK3527595.1 hypothetical protein QTP86_030508 [Hemibagrus guttatus]
MAKRLYIILILLEAVLHGTDSTVEPAISVSTSITPETSPEPITNSTEPITNSTEPITNSTEPITNSTVESTTAGPSTEAPDTSSPGGGSGGNTHEGLTPGEAAGVAVGTIAGVAALGGGIYAGLKYTGRLG